jgi:hypothetical protein
MESGDLPEASSGSPRTRAGAGRTGKVAVLESCAAMQDQADR